MTEHLRKAAVLAALAVSAGGAGAQGMNDVPFTCTDGRILTVDFTGDTARVTMSMSLDARPAASGFAYDGPAGALSGQGDEVTWQGSGPVTCSAVPGGAALVGGTWELVQVMQAGTDGDGVEAEDPARHSLTFLADGALVLRADCNRGRGTWTATPEDAGSGALALGPAAVTRMACADDPFPRMAGDLAGAVAYGVEDGTLRIDMRDGAIYRFRAAPR